MLPKIQIDQQWERDFLQTLEQPLSCSTWQQYCMAVRIGRENIISEFQGLESPNHLPNLTFHSYQYETAQKAIEEMNGKAILADEVGLGKTIEAGLILKEYMIRGLVQKVLILAPASLVTQWCMELNEKFYIPAIEQRKNPQWEAIDVMVTSIDTAKRENHSEVIKQINYDMVIIDEAHRLKNKKTKNYQFVRDIKRKFCLLLTATPVQNKLSELFHLISLLKPGYLGDEETFSRYYGEVEKHEELKELIQKVMIRNRRHETKMKWPKRIVETIPVRFKEDQKKVYENICLLKEQLKHDSSSMQAGFLVLTLQREMCSSREAVFVTLKNTLEKQSIASTDLSQEISQIVSSLNDLSSHPKAEKVLELIQQWKEDEKVVIFTEYRATQLYLQWFLAQNGIRSVPFRGGFKRSKKDWMKQLFKNQVQVLIATEAGGEGINLQFCHRIINYDLPWNPMRIEQRIGRIHRLGQESDVYIYHLAVEDTIEDHIIQLLYKKIGLFEGVVGELDQILEKFGDRSIQEHISSIFSQSDSKGEMKVKMDHLTSIMFDQEKDGSSHAAN
ncbi:ATP-dependent helicase [Salipaludibacillus keqinensis]|uniref:ATP-dependent helicase n=1 Tax=Salipaludibacillus keqinensis TaxID=2045207 RepID=A0A323THL1_9BACI|nr:SNF2-related protein [Salipaludibacillus keqinensis]PYZ94328.1 ATP-dependent helicase [Salipaludibacillus keqinensis]